MSDDLIKRDDAPEQIFASRGDDGWRWPRASKFPEQGPHENVKYVRADRIEQLERELDEARHLQSCACNYDTPTDVCMGHHTLFERLYAAERGRLEAKLAEAVEALREITGRHIPDCPASFGGDELEWAVRQHTALRATARTTLAKLEGKE